MTAFRSPSPSGRHNRDSWPEISTFAALALEKDAKLWFEHILGDFKKAALTPEAQKLGGSVALRTELAGEAEIAVKAYQLIYVSRTLSIRKYVPESEGKDFADLLWAQVCGTNLDDVVDRAHFYTDAGGREEEISRFSGDLSEYIVGEFCPFSVMMAVTMQVAVPEFIGHVVSIVANAFGDSEAFDDLQEQLRRMR